jgi:hypothetical protein
MFAAIRVPASRTSAAYVCYACRSQRRINPQQWRTLSTEPHSTTKPQELSPLPPPPKPTYPSSDPVGNPDELENSSRAQPSSANDAKKSSSADVDAPIPDDSTIPQSLTGDGESKSTPKRALGKTAQKIEMKRLGRMLRERRKAFKERKVPLPTYRTVNDGGVIRCWQAEVTFEGHKFEVEAANKKAAAAKLQDKVMEYIRTVPAPARDANATESSALDLEDPRESSKRATRLRMMSTLAQIGKANSPRRTSERPEQTDMENTPRVSLREALTAIKPRVVGRHTSMGKERSKQSRGAQETGHGLPNNIRSHFKPTKQVDTLNASSLEAVPLHIPQSTVPPLSFGLDRVLFNPGVYRLRDPRSRVYNFDPYLEKVVPSDEFDFAALKGYKVASTDPTLSNIAAENGVKYFTSTSSLTSVLMTFHFLISQWRPIDISMLSKKFDGPDQTNFTTFTKSPTSIILKPKNGGYAIDKDDDGFGNTVLSLVGRSLEKLLTVPKKEFEKYRKSSVTGKSSVEGQDTEEAFHYTRIGNLLVRSQLDGHDPRLPGTGVFDIKTRAVLPVRMDGKGKMEVASSYEIRNDHGLFESFEREYHDMLRAPMLKYSMQARLGRMDGIFVAYHNISRLFGFQYVSLEEIDRAIHGSSDTFRGDQELRASINILQDVLDRASERFPDQVSLLELLCIVWMLISLQPLRIMFETRPGDVPYMNIFVEPVTTEYLEERAAAKQRQIDEFENAVIFPNTADSVDASVVAAHQPWDQINEQVQNEIEVDDGVEAKHHDSIVKLFKPKVQEQEEAQSEPKGATQRLRELLAGQAKERASDLDPKDQLVRAQAAAVDIIRETSKFREADIINSKRPERKQELTKIMAATKALDKWITTLDKELSSTMDTEMSEQIGRLREVTKQQLEEGTNLRASHYADATPILAMALTVRNKINGAYVQGPPEVDRETDWDIEYSIQEMEVHEQAWERYDACKARRDNASAFGKDDPESDERWYGGRFMRELAEWSRKGADWRARQDEIDAGIGRPTVFEPIDKSLIFEVADSAEEVVKDVDEYMSWLYEGKGGDGKKEV